MKLSDLLFGKPLRSSEEAGEKLGPVGGLSVFGLDALSSAAYGPEAALTLMIPLAAAGIAYIVPITASIIILLAIVYFSYRQTIEAYPGGGGSYTVARVNLRGVRETGAVFIIPTYLFVGTLLFTLILGLVKTLAAGGHPVPVVAPPL